MMLKSVKVFRQVSIPIGSRTRNLSVHKQLSANKTGLSYELDSTMRDGHHDMVTFGAGFLRSVSSLEEQAHTLESLRLAYLAMETSLDGLDENCRAAVFWKKFGKDLRKADKLEKDVETLSAQIGSGCALRTPAAERYAAAILEVSNNAINNDPRSKGDLLLGHAYVRYLADLFGGTWLGKPTKLVLKLEEQPTFYNTPAHILAGKKAYIESFYQALNDAGSDMGPERWHEVVLEARKAYKYNADIYRENPGFVMGAMKGGVMLTAAYVGSRLSGSMKA